MICSVKYSRNNDDGNNNNDDKLQKKKNSFDGETNRRFLNCNDITKNL